MTAPTKPHPPRGYLAAQFGEQLTAQRGDRSQRAYAETVLGIAPMTLRELETGVANPTLGRIERIAEAADLIVTITLEPKGDEYP